tara:strand:+ start:1254 stop:1574 length:321 start_codon:yes stop_codon:yes gene_type:complete
MKKINIILVLLFLTTLTNSCKSLKDGLSGRKQNNSDEFLVQKKNPLVLPPGYKDLPTPGNSNEMSKNNKSNEEVQKLLGVIQNKKGTTTLKNGSLEKYVLENIKDN